MQAFKWAVLAATMAILVQAGTSIYSAYVASTNHRTYCTRTGVIIDSFEDVIVLALTPKPGQILTATQTTQIASFETKAFARLDKARC